MAATAYADTFAAQNLPPAGAWPEMRFDLPEVANAVTWLCLPGSDAMNGQAIAVAGGEIM
jgi:hypothetical protein